VTLYELLLFVHVLAAAAWFGAAFLLLLLVELGIRSGDTATILRMGEYEDRFAKVLFIPSALVVLVVGIALTFDGPWSFGRDGWVIAGLAIFAAVFILGVALIVPAGNRLKELAASGAPDGEIRAQIGRIRTLSWVDIGLLTAAFFFMTAKPF